MEHVECPIMSDGRKFLFHFFLSLVIIIFRISFYYHSLLFYVSIEKLQKQFDTYNENTPIRIYWKIYHQKWKLLDKNSDMFPYFCSKHRCG